MILNPDNLGFTKEEENVLIEELIKYALDTLAIKFGVGEIYENNPKAGGNTDTAENRGWSTP